MFESVISLHSPRIFKRFELGGEPPGLRVSLKDPPAVRANWQADNQPRDAVD